MLDLATRVLSVDVLVVGLSIFTRSRSEDFFSTDLSTLSSMIVKAENHQKARKLVIAESFMTL